LVEIKVARSDFLNELKHREKHQVFVEAGCDFVWLAAPPEVADTAELLPDWGHLVYQDGKVRAARKPPKYRNPTNLKYPEKAALKETMRRNQRPVDR